MAAACEHEIDRLREAQHEEGPVPPDHAGPEAAVELDVAAAQPLLEAEEGACAHMNADHSEAVRLYATRLLGAPEGDWRCVGCDPEGMDLALDRSGSRVGLRLPFPRPVHSPGVLRQVLKELAEQARAA